MARPHNRLTALLSSAGLARAGLVFMALLWLTACASTRDRGPRIERPMLYVENDLPIPVTIWVGQTEGFESYQLGIIPPHRAGCVEIPEFVLDPRVFLAETHDDQQLIARTTRVDWRSRRGWAIHLTTPPSNLLTPTPSTQCLEGFNGGSGGFGAAGEAGAV